MTPAATHRSDARALDSGGDAHYRLLGLMIIALFPALFWTGLLALVGAAIGQPPSVVTLTTVGAAIATFLFAATAALFAKTA
jgi:glucose uptake protein GlcU